MTSEVTLIGGDGDGVGAQLADAARRALDATGAQLAWDEPAGEEVLASVGRTGVALRAPGPDGLGARLRSELDLFAGVLPCKAYEGARTRFPETDIVIVREHAAGGDGLALGERVVRAAFDYARDHDRRAVAATGPGDAGRSVAGDYAELEYADTTIDDLCVGLVSHPEAHDVIVLPGVYGDILGPLGAGMVGGLGVAPAVSVGTSAAVFEVAHGCVANPTALMLSGVLLLRHIGEPDAADRLEAAIASVIRRGESVTYDLKPTPNDPSAVGTSEFADAVIEEMNK